MVPWRGHLGKRLWVNSEYCLPMTVDEIKGETPVDTPRLTSRDRLRSGDSGIQFVSWKQDRKKQKKKSRKDIETLRQTCLGTSCKHDDQPSSCFKADGEVILWHRQNTGRPETCHGICLPIHRHRPSQR